MSSNLSVGPSSKASAGHSAGPSSKASAGHSAGPSPKASAGPSAGPSPKASVGPSAGPSSGEVSTATSVKKSKLTIAVASKLGSGIVLKCRTSVTVGRLAVLYARLTKTPLTKVNLSYKNRFLLNEETLEDIGMENNKIIEVHDVIGIAEYNSVEYIFCH